MARTDILKHILALVETEFRPLAQRARRKNATFPLVEMEAAVAVALRKIGAQFIQLLCETRTGKQGKWIRGHSDVGTGQHWLEFKGVVSKNILTLFGGITFRRAYYHSQDPKDSRWPRDEELGLRSGQSWSLGVVDAVAFGNTTTGSYQQGQKTVKKYLDLDIEYKQGQRECLVLGEELEAEQNHKIQEVFEQLQPPPSVRLTPACVMLGVDGVIVDGRDGRGGMELKIGRVTCASLQAPKKRTAEVHTVPAAAAEESDPAVKRQKELAELKDSREKREYNAASALVTRGLKEVAPERDKKPMYRPSTETSSYVATARHGIEMIGQMMWLSAQQLGLENAQLVLFLADGGKWCWNICKLYFPQAIQILDVFHLSGHLIKAGRVLWGEKTSQAFDWPLSALTRILSGRLDEVLTELQELEFMTKEKQETQHELIGYLTNNCERMNYLLYLEKGYPISSAMIEGACGHVIGQRMKGSGRHWDEDGADAMARLRSIWCGGQWETFFSERQRKQQQNLRSLKLAA